MTLLILYLLALLDGLLCGLRASMGRCPLIRKRGYYARALFQGIVGSHIVSVLALTALVVATALSSHRGVLRADLELAAGRMLRILFRMRLWCCSTSPSACFPPPTYAARPAF